ncbi:MAG TPA: ATP-dependent DNA ligase [Candidatus Eisenbacteria bacterium]|nr:ATP-dependent DNA ligase [Candidatus Eisenbacteria bacterium]
MTFSKLASYFEKLEGTSSRLSLISLLSDLFKQIDSPEEIEKVCYLVQGRIAPFFEATEIGMADKMVAVAIGQAYDISKEEVLKAYSKKGDMGIVVWELAQNEKGKKKNEKSVTDVFNSLVSIAKTGGEGSVEKKIAILSDLLKGTDSLSAKFLVRIPLGNLRLGIGDPTVLDALATARLGDKSQRHYLEDAYNRTSDLGLIAKTLWGVKNPIKAVEAVEKLEVTVGKPIRSELCERLPSPEKTIEKMGTVDSQFKYDGFRVQIHKDGDTISLFSRNLENMTHMFPEIIEGAKRQIKAKTAILDTEALAYNPDSEEFLPFQETTKRRRKHNIEETMKSLPLRSFVFDILYRNGKSLIGESLEKRLVILSETVENDDTLFVAETKKIDDAKVLSLMLDDAISKGLEGIVVKKLQSPYEAGARNFNWVKLKRNQSGELNDTIDCVILGYVFGKGKRTAFGAGALLVGIYDKKSDSFVTVSKIGTGLSDEEWKSIKERTKGLEVDHKPARVESLITPSVWVKPEIVIEVLADEITRSPIHTAGAVMNEGKVVEPGYALRFPRLVTFRDADKKAEEATEVKELIEMYNQQGKK